MNLKIKLKKGDEVIILSGKDKGKVGKITLVKPQINKAIVTGINKVKKHQKPDNNQAGGIVEKEMPIQISNLAYYDNISKKGVKLGFKFNEKKEKKRVIRSSGKEV
jgi:large subunit ribosomal protein L24